MHVSATFGLLTLAVALVAQTAAPRVIDAANAVPVQRAVAAVVDEPGHQLEIENERVRVYRVTLDPGDSLPVHTHTAGWIAVTIIGGSGPGTYRWYDAGVANPLTAGQYPLEVVELEPR